MYKVQSISIKGFWGRYSASVDFNEDVNIIIGRNGTGKTTFMNILHSVLTVDINGLFENEFNEVKIILSYGKKRKTVEVIRNNFDIEPVPVVDYKISGRKTSVRLFGLAERSSHLAKRRIYEDSKNLKEELNSIIPVSSLSVYRLRNEDEFEVRDRHGISVMSPVDYRLDQALNRLTRYQFKLALEARKVSEQLQTDVLASILYTKDDDKNELYFPKEFNLKEEQERLISSYKQLNSYDSSIKTKIKYHVEAISNSIQEIKDYEKDRDLNSSLNLKPLEAYSQTKKIIDFSLEAKEKTKKIFSRVDIFLDILSGFIPDKKFIIEGGKLVISNSYDEINHAKLSSGEKQLIILLVEALLQDYGPHLFLADEPELSLHIAWQKIIIPSIKKINPNAQVIVATHSPEVASNYRDYIINMEKVVNG